MKQTALIYFVVWLLVWVGSCVLLVFNIDFNRVTTGTWSTLASAVTYTVIAALLHVGVVESLVKAIFAFCCATQKSQSKLCDVARCSVCINYNLLAWTREDVEECFGHMFEAFMGNLTDILSAVVVCATDEDALINYELEIRDRYRLLIYHTLYDEIGEYISHDTNMIHPFRAAHLWHKIEVKHGIDWMHNNAEDLCVRISRQFMCVHRTSRVLKKCGQYQDLIVLSEGHFSPYTYTDTQMYGIHTRSPNERMFNDTADVHNLFGRKFEFTLVMDSDSRLTTGALLILLSAAVDDPKSTIFQPRVQLDMAPTASIYMWLEHLRQEYDELVRLSMWRVLGEASYHGKALIRNRSYIAKILGLPNKPMEMVPSNALSHDLYESYVAHTTYVPEVSIIERPTFNYLTWNARLRRWCLGDLILSTFYHTILMGSWIKMLQRCCQTNYIRVRLRKHVRFNCARYYLISMPLRSMFEKPLWFIYIILHTCVLQVYLRHPWIQLIVIMGSVCVVCRIVCFLKCRSINVYILLELIASIFQFTPEVFTGTVRLMRSIWYLVSDRKQWIPQRYVEDEFLTTRKCRIMTYSLEHLWGYTFISLILIALIVILGYFDIVNFGSYILALVCLSVTALLPMFCFFTSLPLVSSCFGKASYVKQRALACNALVTAIGVGVKSTEIGNCLVGPGKLTLVYNERIHMYFPEGNYTLTSHDVTTNIYDRLNNDEMYDNIETTIEYYLKPEVQ